jgi:hypothetical protein
MFDKISSGKIYGNTGNQFSAIEIDGDGVLIRNAADEIDSSGNLVSAGSDEVLSASRSTGTTINASYIKTGVIDANLMRAGLIQTVPSWNTKWYGAPEDHAAVQMGFTGGSIAATAVSTGTGTVSLTLPGGHGLITGDYVRVSGLYFTTGTLLGGVGLNLPTNGPLDYAAATVATNTLTYSKADITSGLTASTASIVYVGKAHTITGVVRSFDEPENPAELSTVVVTTSAAHGFSVGEYVELVNVAPTIDGVAYITAVTSTTFTFKQRFGADIELDLAEVDPVLPDLGAPVAIKVLKSYTQNADGSIHITSGTVDSTLIVGEIAATEITIGSGEGVVRVGSYPDAITPTFQGIWAGSANPSTAEFSANTSGAVTASNLTVTGGSITIGDFSLSTGGQLTDDLVLQQTRITNDSGVTIIDTDSDGEKSTLFGGAALREIQAGVANGSFAEPPPSPYANVGGANKLPYWTFTDVNSAGAITAAIVADAGAASGNVLRFTVASGTLTGKSATLTRYVPVASSASRSFSFYAEATFDNATNSTQANAKLTCEFYKSDGVTATGTPFESLLYGFNLLQTPTGITAPDLWETSPDLTDSTAPADAAYLKVTITIATVATQSANRVVDLTEVRVGNGLPELILTDKSTPTNLPAYIINDNNELSMYNGSQSGYVIVGDETLVAGAISATVTSLEDVIIEGYVATSINSVIGPVNITAATAVDITAPSGVDVSNNLNVDGTIGVLGSINIGVSDTSTVGDITFKGGNGGSIRAFSAAAGNDSLGIYNTAGTDFTNLVAESFFPGGQGSFRLTHDGNFDFNDTVDVTGSITASSSIVGSSFQSTGSLTALNASGGGDITLTGADTSVPISGNGELLAIANTTTATTNSARWVLTSGSTYALRRDSSTRRVKTNIVQADSAVLAAAKNLRAVHYEALEKDNEGNVVPSGKHTLGLIAEEIAEAGLGCAVTYDGEGLPDGYDERVIIAALLHRLNDLEARLAELEGNA